jgi:hypothetical protein
MSQVPMGINSPVRPIRLLKLVARQTDKTERGTANNTKDGRRRLQTTTELYSDSRTIKLQRQAAEPITHILKGHTQSSMTGGI